MSDGKQIVFAGHSSGGPIAILADGVSNIVAQDQMKTWFIHTV